MRLLKGDAPALATLLFAHSFFSILFHLTHTPHVKRVDVMLNVAVFATAAFRGVWTVYCPVIFASLVSVLLLWVNPVTRNNGILALKAHVCIHCVATVGLLHLPL